MIEFLDAIQSLHAQIFDPARLPVAAVALVIVSLFGMLWGPLGGNTAPFLWRAVDFLFGGVGGKLDNTGRGRAELVTRGAILVFAAMIMGFLAGQFLQTLSLYYPNYKIIDIVAMSIILSAGALWYALIRLYKAINGKGKIKGAFYALSVSTRTNLAMADEYTITREGIAAEARLFDKGIVAPVLWYLIAGLPGAFLYAALAAFAWRFGKDGFTKGFGVMALQLEKLMGFVPNVLAGLLLAMGGLLTPTARMSRSLWGILAGRKGHATYFEGGLPVTAMAWALDVTLGGAVQDHDGSALKRGWAGPPGATARLGSKHLHRAIYIGIMAHLLFLATLLVAIVIGGRGLFWIGTLDLGG